MSVALDILEQARMDKEKYIELLYEEIKERKKRIDADECRLKLLRSNLIEIESGIVALGGNLEEARKEITYAQERIDRATVFRD